MIRRIVSLQPLRWPGAQPAQGADCREAAMPGQPVRARARFQFPPAIHPRELPAATGVTAIVVRQAARDSTYSLNPLSARMFRTATEKPLALVQKLWTTRLPCGSLRKSADESRHEECGTTTFQ